MTEKELIEIIKEIAECNKDSCKDCKIICTYYSAITSFCEKVLPEGSVVFQQKDLTKLQNAITQSCNSKFDVDVVNCLTNKVETLEQELKDLRKKLKQARKEIAKEFALKVKESKEIKEFVECYTISYVDLCKGIDEIAKQFGIEVKNG